MARRVLSPGAVMRTPRHHGQRASGVSRGPPPGRVPPDAAAPSLAPAGAPRLRALLAVCAALALAAGTAWAGVRALAPRRAYRIGEVVDSLDGVPVYYNGRIGQRWGRTVAADGYNVGVRYQCVEFVKRYYHQRFGHRMPDPWGHAVDYFDPGVPDGGWNARRGLVQHTNPSRVLPARGDILVFGGHAGNPYGHVAIVARVDRDGVQLIQQNPGASAPSRLTLPLDPSPGGWRVRNGRVLGWLRLRRR